jgi:CHAP domain
MKLPNFQPLVMLILAALVTITSHTPSFAGKKKQAPTATPNQINSSTNEDEETKQEHSAGKESHERFVNQGAEEAPISPTERQEADKKPAMSHGEKAVKKALTQLGNGENPPGSNCQKYSRYFGKSCQYWCADFVSWAFDTTGNKNKKLPWVNPSSVSSIIAWGQNGHQVKTPRPGDLFTMKGPGVSHTGLVRKVSGNSFYSVEGNANNSVRSLKRPLSLAGVTFFRVSKGK